MKTCESHTARIAAPTLHDLVPKAAVDELPAVTQLPMPMKVALATRRMPMQNMSTVLKLMAKCTLTLMPSPMGLLLLRLNPLESQC